MFKVADKRSGIFKLVRQVVGDCRASGSLFIEIAEIFTVVACTTNDTDRTIPTDQAVRNIVLVHGAFADGSGWREVYDDLTERGYRVTIVQNPLTSFEDDVAATRRILARQNGPTILVGHSYGGSIITESGLDPNVVGLVYVSALAPDVGESTGQQFAESRRRLNL